MADSSTSEFFDTDQILTLFKRVAASGGELNFAFGMASKPEEIALAVSLIKQPSALKTLVKDAPKVSKICIGKITVDGKRVLIQPKRPIPRMTKTLQRRFKLEGLTIWKAILVDDSGREIDDEALPEPEDEGDESEDAKTSESGAPPEGGEPASGEAGDQKTSPSETSPELQALKARLAKLTPAIAKLGPDAAAKLVPACKVAAKQIADGDAAAATKSLGQIEAVVLKLLSGAKAGQTSQGGDEAEAKQQAEKAEAKRQADEAEAKRLADEADAKRQADEADAKRQADEAEAKRQADAEKAKAAVSKMKELLAKLIKDLRSVPDEADRARLALEAREVNRLLGDPDLQAAVRAFSAFQKSFEAARQRVPGSDEAKLATAEAPDDVVEESEEAEREDEDAKSDADRASDDPSRGDLKTSPADQEEEEEDETEASGDGAEQSARDEGKTRDGGEAEAEEGEAEETKASDTPQDDETKRPDYAALAKLWDSTLAEMKSEMAKLEAAILSTISPDPRYAPVVAEARDLGARLAPFETVLGKALTQAGKAGSASDHDKMRRSASDLLASLSRELNSKFFQDLDANNGFVAVKVTSTAQKALKQIAAELA